MKIFHTGDRVRFISTKGSGIVTTVNKGIVNVLIEDGFEIPVEASDLVIIENVTENKNPFIRKGEFSKMEKMQEKPEIVVKVETNTESETPQKKENAVAPEKGLYMAFMPLNQETLISDDLEVYLINYSSWQVAYNLLKADSRRGYSPASTGLIEKGDAMLVDTVSHSDLKLLSKLRLQLLCLDSKEGQLFDSEIVDVDIKTSKFINEDLFTKNPFFDELAHVIYIHDLSHPPLSGHVKEAQTIPTTKPKTYLIDRYMVDAKMAEVDLHIEKLRGDHKTMKKEDMMPVQLAFFRQCLESAIEKGIEKVVFIHGVGAGLLKKELHDILNQYENLQHADASIMKYGIGATEINLMR